MSIVDELKSLNSRVVGLFSGRRSLHQRSVSRLKAKRGAGRRAGMLTRNAFAAGAPYGWRDRVIQQLTPGTRKAIERANREILVALEAKRQQRNIARATQRLSEAHSEVSEAFGEGSLGAGILRHLLHRS